MHLIFLNGALFVIGERERERERRRGRRWRR
jgi:hypothetical protein